MDIKKEIKFVICGDGAVGKTCLLMRFQNDMFPDDYIPTLVDNFVKDFEHKEIKYKINLFDTAGYF